MKNKNKTVHSKNLIEAYLLDKYEFRYNIYTSSVECRKIQDSSFKDITDFVLHSIIRELEENNLKISKGKLDNLLQSDFSNRTGRKYLSGLLMASLKMAAILLVTNSR